MYMFPNHKKYVGKTMRSLEERQGANFCRYKRCSVLWKAIQKYGVENIEQAVLVEADMEDERAAEIERAYIDLWKTNCCRYNNPSRGYNLTDGGEGVAGWTPDEERLEVLRGMMAEFHERRRGTTITDEHREKLR